MLSSKMRMDLKKMTVQISDDCIFVVSETCTITALKSSTEKSP